MGFDELKKKAGEFLGDEARTDDALDRAADLARGRAGRHTDKVDQAREFLDGKVGDERGGSQHT